MDPRTIAARDVVMHRVLFCLRRLVSAEVLQSIARNLERLLELEQHDPAWRGELADHVAGSIAMDFRAGLAAVGEHKVTLEVRVPDGRWQLLRAALLPAFWLRRYPLRERAIRKAATVYQAVCPHTSPRHERDHFAFLAESAAMPWDPDQSMREEVVRPPVQKKGGRHA